MATYTIVGVGTHKKYFDDKAYEDTLDYIFRGGKVRYAGGAHISSMETAAEEMKATAERFNKNSGKRVRHSVLSFAENEGITPEQADAFGKQIVEHYAPEHQIAYAVHEDTDDVHIHFVMNQFSHLDGHRYSGRKKDYYDFQRHMRKVTRLPIKMVKNNQSE